jgi:hypothetical protein
MTMRIASRFEGQPIHMATRTTKTAAVATVFERERRMVIIVLRSCYLSIRSAPEKLQVRDDVVDVAVGQRDEAAQ